MTKSTISLRLIAVFFVFLFAYLFLLGRIGMPLAHDSFDPLVMRDTCLLLSALIDRGVSFKDLVVEAMKHLEGPTQFVLMNLYCLGIQDAFPLTPATMQFPNTVLGIMAAAFAFSVDSNNVRYANGLSYGDCFGAHALVRCGSQVNSILQYVGLITPLFYDLFSCKTHDRTKITPVSHPGSALASGVSILEFGLAIIFSFRGTLLHIKRQRGRYAP